MSNQFAAILPEAILAIGAIVLMMVAAFGGRRARRLISWLAVALLLARDGRADRRAEPRRPGVLRADHRRPVRRFGKALIFPAAAVAIIAAHGWFERDTEHGAEYAVLILFSAVGMSVMVSATSLISLYVGLELQSLVGLRARLLPPHATSARPRRASNISCSARLPAGSCSTAFRCSTALPGRRSFTGIAAAFGRGAPVARPAVRPRLPARRPGVQGQRGAVPHVDARRLRRRADAGHRLLRLGAQGRGGAARDPRLPRRARPGDRRLAADRDRRRAGLDLPRRGRRLRPDQHQAAARLFVDQQCRLRADRACRRRRRKGASSVLFYMAVYVVMTLGAFLCVLWMRDADGRAGRGHRQPVGPVADPARPSPRRSRSSCSAWPGSRRCSASGRSCWCSTPRSTAAMSRLRWPASSAPWSALIITSGSSRSMYFDDPARRYARGAPAAPGRADPARGADRLAARLSADRPARRRLTDARRGIALLSRIRIVERTGSTNADLLADHRGRRRRLAGRASSSCGQGPPGPRVAIGAGQFLRQHLGRAARRRPAAAEPVAGRRPGAGRSGRRRRARTSRCCSNGPTTCCSTAPSSPGSCSNAAATGSSSASASISPPRPTLDERRTAHRSAAQ